MGRLELARYRTWVRSGQRIRNTRPDPADYCHAIDDEVRRWRSRGQLSLFMLYPDWFSCFAKHPTRIPGIQTQPLSSVSLQFTRETERERLWC